MCASLRVLAGVLASTEQRGEEHTASEHQPRGERLLADGAEVFSMQRGRALEWAHSTRQGITSGNQADPKLAGEEVVESASRRNGMQALADGTQFMRRDVPLNAPSTNLRA